MCDVLILWVFSNVWTPWVDTVYTLQMHISNRIQRAQNLHKSRHCITSLSRNELPSAGHGNFSLCQDEVINEFLTSWNRPGAAPSWQWLPLNMLIWKPDYCVEQSGLVRHKFIIYFNLRVVKTNIRLHFSITDCTDASFIWSNKAAQFSLMWCAVIIPLKHLCAQKWIKLTRQLFKRNHSKGLTSNIFLDLFPIRKWPFWACILIRHVCLINSDYHPWTARSAVGQPLVIFPIQC